MRVLLVLLLGAQAVLGAAATNLFETNPALFAQASQRSLAMDSVNNELIAAAVLHETNRHRRQRNLQPLKGDSKAMEAARIQSEIMRNRGSISHVNPENEKYRTLDQRVKAAGLKPRMFAENVATAFALRYEGGKPYYPDTRNGRTVFRHQPNGPPMQAHSYASFAKALVDSWMGSKGHRENILRKEAQFMGSYCAPAPGKGSEMPIFYCTQVFFAPLPQARGN